MDAQTVMRSRVVRPVLLDTCYEARLYKPTDAEKLKSEFGDAFDLCFVPETAHREIVSMTWPFISAHSTFASS